MVALNDGRTYRILNKINHRVISVSHDDKSPGGWLTLHNYDKDDHENVFKAHSLPGNKWKFTLVEKPDMCIGFHGKVCEEGLRLLQIVQDNGEGAHAEWSVMPGNAPNQFEIYTHTGTRDVCWTVPDSARAGTVVGLVGFAERSGQQWTFAVPVDSKDEK